MTTQYRRADPGWRTGRPVVRARAARARRQADRRCWSARAELGGIPRHCGHIGFGLREFGRLYSGPDYAKRLADEAAGADLRPRMTALKIEPGGLVRATGPNGAEDLQAKAVLSWRSARAKRRAARA